MSIVKLEHHEVSIREYFNAEADFEQLVQNVTSRPSMWVASPTFDTVCAFFEGYDHARSGGPLVGLHQWLVVQVKTGDNLTWPGLVRIRLKLPFHGAAPNDEDAIRALGMLLSEFIEYRRTFGLTKIFYDYGKWLLRQSW